ncbi:MAG: S-layer homology domain-containing protein [Clostridia bacterium]|nr:MAG: S-layer homology domain-containing protein [Clostridia bacterium]
MGKGKRMKIVLLVIIAVVSLLWPAVAMAQQADLVNDGSIEVKYFHGGSPGFGSKLNWISRSNAVTITMQVYSDAWGPDTLSDTFKVGSVTEGVYRYGTTGDYADIIVTRYDLRPGVNRISLRASGYPSETLTITYQDLPEIDGQYLGEMKNGKLEAFQKAVSLNFPKTVYLYVYNNNSREPVTDQSLRLEVVRTPEQLDTVVAQGLERPDERRAFVSPVFHVGGADNQAAFSEPGTITLAFAPQVSTLAADTISIGYKEDLSSQWTWIGGVTDARKHTITAPFKGMGYYAVFNATRGFAEFDMPDTLFAADDGTHPVDLRWSRQYVETLWAKGIMTGGYDTLDDTKYTKYEFGLAYKKGGEKVKEVPVARGEFAAMMVKGIGWPLVPEPANGKRTFDDTYDSSKGYLSAITYDTDGVVDKVYAADDYAHDPNHYADSLTQYLETAARNGMINGYPVDNNDDDIPDAYAFRPEDTLTRQEAATIIARTMNLKLETDQAKVDAALQKQFSDASSIGEWARPYVLAAAKTGYFEGYGSGTFGPNDKLTRSQAAKLVYLVMKEMKKI